MSLSPTEQNSELSFQDLNLNGPILKAIQDAGYETATPIQARAIPPLLEGRDVLGQAQTGTGKTAAFAIPMLQRLDPSVRKPQVLVLAPTRELAIQVSESFERYAAGIPDIRVAAIYGGQDYPTQFRQLDRGVHVVVGTPGRVMDHIRRGSLKLDALRGLVLDEADEMLRMGFADDVEWILGQVPAERQIALFSATMSETIRRIAQSHLRDPVEITIKQATATADTVRQRFVVASSFQKQEVLALILEAEPIDGVIIFVKTKSTTDPLAEFLGSKGYKAGVLSSDVAQKQRERTIDNLRSGKLDVIIATDVAARGLDVQRISHVINYDLPFDSESYVHRIGRTGRAGRTGNAILFLQPRERHLLRRLERATRHAIEPMEIPTKRAINQRRVARFHERITEALANPNLKTYVSLIEQYRAKNEEAAPDEIAAALAILAAGDTILPMTEDPKVGEFAEPAGPRGGDRRRMPQRSFEGDWRMEPDGRIERGPRPRRHNERMETFRIEVGHAHQVKPGNIVGAIANETGLESSFIGRIEIFDEFSTVDMLAGMPIEMFNGLKNVWVAGRQLNISRVDDAPAVHIPSEHRQHDRPQRPSGPTRLKRPRRAGA